MKIRLGYACVPLSIAKTSSHLMTYSHFKKIGEEEGLKKLDKIIIQNLIDLEEIIRYNIKNNIHFFRLTSALIPLATHPDVNFCYIEKYQEYYLKIGKLIHKHNLRVDVHPDQFCVLNSDNKEVVKRSVEILEYLANILISLNIETPLMVLHVGSAKEGKTKAIKRFIENFWLLDENIKKMIILENDDKIYNIRNVLGLCKKINIPFVLDYHHYKCNNSNELITDYIKDIFLTWKDINIIPKVHFSTSKNKTKKDKRSHNDYIDVLEFIRFIDKIKFTNQDFDIMIEAKEKDMALFKLVRELKYLTNYEFIDETTFIVR